MSHGTYVAVIAALWIALAGAVALGVWAVLTRQSGAVLLLVALSTWLLASVQTAGRYLLVIPLLAAALGVVRLARPRPLSAAVLVGSALLIYAVALLARL